MKISQYVVQHIVYLHNNKMSLFPGASTKFVISCKVWIQFCTILLILEDFERGIKHLLSMLSVKNSPTKTLFSCHRELTNVRLFTMLEGCIMTDNIKRSHIMMYSNLSFCNLYSFCKSNIGTLLVTLPTC